MNLLCPCVGGGGEGGGGPLEGVGPENHIKLTTMVRRGLVGSASACCKAGPSSILGSVLQEVLSH